MGSAAEKDDVIAAMSRAVTACVQHLKDGGIPFIGVVIKDGEEISGHAGNRVLETGDSTAHAEIVAMREAMKTHGKEVLQKSALYATGEPCGMCYRFALAHGVQTIYVAVDRHTVAEWGFDYRDSYPAYNIGDNALAGIVHHIHVDGALSPFQEFARKHDLFRRSTQ